MQNLLAIVGLAFIFLFSLESHSMAAIDLRQCTSFLVQNFEKYQLDTSSSRELHKIKELTESQSDSGGFSLNIPVEGLDIGLDADQSSSNSSRNYSEDHLIERASTAIRSLSRRYPEESFDLTKHCMNVIYRAETGGEHGLVCANRESSDGLAQEIFCTWRAPSGYERMIPKVTLKAKNISGTKTPFPDTILHHGEETEILRFVREAGSDFRIDIFAEDSINLPDGSNPNAAKIRVPLPRHARVALAAFKDIGATYTPDVILNLQSVRIYAKKGIFPPSKIILDPNKDSELVEIADFQVGNIISRKTGAYSENLRQAFSPSVSGVTRSIEGDIFETLKTNWSTPNNFTLFMNIQYKWGNGRCGDVSEAKRIGTIRHSPFEFYSSINVVGFVVDCGDGDLPKPTLRIGAVWEEF